MLQITALAVQVAHEEWGPAAPRDNRELLPFITQFQMYVWPSGAWRGQVYGWMAARVLHTVQVPA